MHLIKVLMADDEESVLEIMARRVASQGYHVITAPDGEVAWAKIQSEDPDVVVLDLSMPKMDGWAVLERLRNEVPARKWRPVIIVSAHTELESIKRGVSLQADHYLTKPCRLEDIVKAIRLMVSLIPQRQL